MSNQPRNNPTCAECGAFAPWTCAVCGAQLCNTHIEYALSITDQAGRASFSLPVHITATGEIAHPDSIQNSQQ